MREKKRSVGRGRQRNQSSNINELATGCFSNFELLDLELLDGVLIFLALGDQILGREMVYKKTCEGDWI